MHCTLQGTMCSYYGFLGGLPIFNTFKFFLINICVHLIYIIKTTVLSYIQINKVCIPINIKLSWLVNKISDVF